MRQPAALALVGIGAFLVPASAAASTWEIDPAHSSIEFSVKHMMVTTVKGLFEKVKGTVDLDEKDLAKSTVDVTIDLASVNTRNQERDAHLRSADFFEVEKFPTATFRSTKIQKVGKNRLKVHGDLTLHGVTKPVVLDVDGPSSPNQTPYGTMVRGVHATTKLDRKDFGLTWNKTLDSGGVLVGNEVALDFNVEIVAKPATAAKPAR